MKKNSLNGIDIVVYDSGKFVIDNDGFFEDYNRAHIMSAHGLILTYALTAMAIGDSHSSRRTASFLKVQSSAVIL